MTPTLLVKKLGFGYADSRRPKPPSSNTGVLITNPCPEPVSKAYSLGWITFTARGSDSRKEFLDYWAAVSGDMWQHSDRGFNGYQASIRSANGVIVGWSPDRSEWTAWVGQSAMGTIDQGQQFDLMHMIVDGWDGKCTRIDSTIDANFDNDSDRNSLKNLVREAVLGDDVRSRSEVGKEYHYPGKPEKGWTQYIGSGKSLSMLRIYDKHAESKGEMNAIRFELELKGEKADSFARQLLESVDSWYEIGVEALRGFVDFVDRGSDSNISRCKLLGWWQKIVGFAGKLRIPIPKPVRTIDNVIDYVVNQVGTSIATLQEYFGVPQAALMIGRIGRQSRGRINISQRNILEQKRLEWAYAYMTEHGRHSD